MEEHMRTTIIPAALAIILLVGCESGTSPESETHFTLTLENTGTEYDYSGSGVFNTPSGSMAPAPIFPGESYMVEFDAAPGSRLSFATMFVQSNDLFYAPDGAGIELYDDMGSQVTGDVTSQIRLWDAGTEVNQEPGLGTDQAPRQSGANTGMEDSDNSVRMAMDEFGNLPAVDEVIQVTLTSLSDTGFQLRITNVSSTATLVGSDGSNQAVPLAPGIWVVHSGNNPLFTAGSMDTGMGLEAIAEDGDPSQLAADFADLTGVTQLLAPGVWVVHATGMPLYVDGSMDAGYGLEALAEDGDPSGLATWLSGNYAVGASGAFDTPIGAAGPGPLAPGQSYSFVFDAMEGDRLSLATMLVQSNDLFIGSDDSGLQLFTNGMARSGDIAADFQIWDAGTEMNQIPGFGLDQAPRQGAAGAGTDENGNVREVDDGYDYPAVSDFLRITLSTE